MLILADEVEPHSELEHHSGINLWAILDISITQVSALIYNGDAEPELNTSRPKVVPLHLKAVLNGPLAPVSWRPKGIDTKLWIGML